MPASRSVVFLDASPVFGGAQRSMLTTIQALSVRGVDPLVITGSGAFGAHLRDAGIPSCRLPFGIWRKSLGGLLRAASDVITFRGFLKSLELDEDAVFYANGIQSGLLLTLTLAKSKPLIFHHRDLRCPKLALRKVLARAHKTVVLSDFMLERLREQFPADALERTVRIYNGFDWDELDARARENVPVEVAIDGISVTFVADVVPWKRHDRFIESMALAIAREPRLCGVIIGGTRDRSGDYHLRRLQRLVASLGIHGSIHFLDYVDNPLPLIQSSSALCTLAEDEPFGRVAVEAAVCGTPLVTVRVGGPAEIAAGLESVCKADATPESIAEAILEAVKLERRQPGDEWKERFSVGTNAMQVLELIKAVGSGV